MKKMTNEEAVIRRFANRVRKARLAWYTSGGDHRSWLNFYEEKSDALDELRTKIPQIAAIDQFFTWIECYHPNIWEDAITEMVKKIRDGVPCVDCGTKIQWPATRCEKCAEAHRKFLEEKREIAKRLRKRKARQ